MSLSPIMLQSSDTGGSIEWATPPEVFDPLHQEFRFELDACANHGMERLPYYIPPEMDGLACHWHKYAKRVWCNPPYGRVLAKWVEKCWKESQEGCTVVMCIFAVTDTSFWHDIVMANAKEIRLVRGRVRFLAPTGTRGPATKGSAIIVFDGPQYRPPLIRSWSPG